jgi:dihydroxyacid dehydratase/phosphogluconate dehydratase
LPKITEGRNVHGRPRVYDNEADDAGLENIKRSRAGDVVIIRYTRSQGGPGLQMLTPELCERESW